MKKTRRRWDAVRQKYVFYEVRHEMDEQGQPVEPEWPKDETLLNRRPDDGGIKMNSQPRERRIFGGSTFAAHVAQGDEEREERKERNRANNPERD